MRKQHSSLALKFELVNKPLTICAVFSRSLAFVCIRSNLDGVWITVLLETLSYLTSSVTCSFYHSERELLGISKESFFFKSINKLLLIVQMLSTLLEILLLFKNTKPMKGDGKPNVNDSHTSVYRLVDVSLYE